MKLPAASPHRLTRAMRHSVGGVSAPASLRSALVSTRQAAGNVPSYDSMRTGKHCEYVIIDINGKR